MNLDVVATIHSSSVGSVSYTHLSPAKGIEVTLPAAAFAGCLRQEEVAFVIQVRSFIEMQLIAACQEALFSVIGLRKMCIRDRCSITHFMSFGYIKIQHLLGIDVYKRQGYRLTIKDI